MSHSFTLHPTLKFILSIERFFFIFRQSTRKLKDIFKPAGFRRKGHYALPAPLNHLNVRPDKKVWVVHYSLILLLLLQYGSGIVKKC